tara:strand:- start:108 stop:287 length:180 start_codon:yes stop_codon:yes gene_type:complete
MTDQDIIDAVDKILENKKLKAELGVTRHDKQNFFRHRSIPKMLELLYKANKLSLKDGST